MQIDRLVERIEDWGRLPEHPIVSVVVSTYNHGRFIRQAIESVLMQEAAFPFEVIVKDDHSTDGTRDIVRSFQRANPDRIRLWLCRKNLWSRRINIANEIRSSCRGRYIALLEGDDYWTDPQKLQKQVDCLESRESYGLCFHRVIQTNPDVASVQPLLIPSSERRDYMLEDFLRHNPFATCSCLYRNEGVQVPSWMSRLPYGDLSLYIWITSRGLKAICLPDVMGCYRVHAGGTHGVCHYEGTPEAYFRAYRTTLRFYAEVDHRMILDRDGRITLSSTMAWLLEQCASCAEKSGRAGLRFEAAGICLRQGAFRRAVTLMPGVKILRASRIRRWIPALLGVM